MVQESGQGSWLEETSLSPQEPETVGIVFTVSRLGEKKPGSREFILIVKIALSR